MTCTHINKAKTKLNGLIEKLNNTSSRVYGEFGPYVNPSDIETTLDSEGFLIVKYTAETKWKNSYKQIVKKNVVEEYLNDIESELNSCNCYANEKIQREGEISRKNDLVDAHREERDSMRNQLDEMRDEYGALRDAHRQDIISMQNQFEGIRNDYKDVVNKQHSLIEREREETSIVRRENSNLQRALGLSEGQTKQLEVQLAERTNELSQNKQALDRLRQAFLDLSISNATNAERARVVSEQLD